MAFDLARLGLGATSPNPAVGALVVQNGRVVGQGYHAKAGEDHAETIALRQAGESARGADLFVNLEPCSLHRILHGRIAPCVDQILAAGIRRVIAAGKDPNPLIDGRGLARLEGAGVAVEPFDPVFSKLAGRFNEVFFKFIATGRPFVVLKAGMTLDGRIALDTGESKWITGSAARAEARRLRGRYDAVLVGVGTAIADDPLLLPRSPDDAADEHGPSGTGGPGARTPLRVVLDSRLRLPLTSRLVATARSGPVLVYAADDAPESAQGALEGQGITVVRKGRGRVPIPFILEDLAAREVTSLLVEGGGETLGAFLRGRHGDKVHLFVAPRILGGRASRPAFGGEGPLTLDDSTWLDDLQVRSAGDALVVEGYPEPLSGNRKG